jgi:hypothetical protein
VIASVAVAALRVAGYGLQGLASTRPELIIFFYLIPLLGGAVALAILFEADVSDFLAPMRAARGASA